MRFKFEYTKHASDFPLNEGRFLVTRDTDATGTIHAGLYQTHGDIPLGKKRAVDLIGAGTFGRSAKVYDWVSGSYGVFTPTELEAPIQQTFNEHKDLIASDKWR